jgi:hypothetical protein
MALLVNNIVSSNIQVNYSYLDTDELFGYIVTANYKINISDIQFEIGNGIFLSGRSAIRAAYERRNITARIGGDEFVNGLITALSFEGGSLVGSEVASVTIEERKRLNDYSSKTFAKYIPSPQFIDSFEETYNFSRQDANYSYTRSISIKYAQDAGDQFLDNARAFLISYYHANRPNLGYYEDGISENARFDEKFYGKLTENIDLIQLSVSLEESFDSSYIDIAKKVSKNISEKVSLNSSGYLNKDITIELTSLNYNAQSTLESAISDIIDEVIAQQNPQFIKPHSIQKGITADSNKASITLSFSTDPTLADDNTILYNCSEEKEGAYLKYTLSSTYSSTGKNVADRNTKTYQLWQSSGNPASKVLALFTPPSQIYELSRNFSVDRARSEITDNVTFTTNDAYDNSALPENIIKYDITVNKTNRIKRNEKIFDVLSLEEKIAVSEEYTLGEATVTAVAVATQSANRNAGRDFLSGKTSEMNSAVDGSQVYGMKDQYTIDLSNGTTTRVISYVYT